MLVKALAKCIFVLLIFFLILFYITVNLCFLFLLWVTSKNASWLGIKLILSNLSHDIHSEKRKLPNLSSLTLHSICFHLNSGGWNLKEYKLRFVEWARFTLVLWWFAKVETRGLRIHQKNVLPYQGTKIGFSPYQEYQEWPGAYSIKRIGVLVPSHAIHKSGSLQRGASWVMIRLSCFPAKHILGVKVESA